MGIGGLPHRDAADAASFALHFMDIPSIPTLPRRSPSEGGIAQAMVGMRGVTVGQYSSIAVDPRRFDMFAPLLTDLDHDAFVGFRAFLDLAPAELGDDHGGWLKWQFVGPVTFGLALMRAGIPASEAFNSAVRAVRTRIQQLLAAVAGAMPQSRQLVFIEEPSFHELMQSDFPITPSTAIDLVSGALAAIETDAISGLHCCADGDCASGDIASQLEAGPSILSLPVRLEVAESAGYLIRFMEAGGYIAWGVVPTVGPIANSADRPWRQLCALWCELVRRGADPSMLRQQALVTPECGLSGHTPAIALQVHQITAEIGKRIRDQAAAAQWMLGA